MNEQTINYRKEKILDIYISKGTCCKSKKSEFYSFITMNVNLRDIFWRSHVIRRGLCKPAV